MKIGLICDDGKNFPNFALMKIAEYEKSCGNDVEFVNFFNSYDKVYRSKVFTNKTPIQTIVNANLIIRGGTGYDYKIMLPESIENIEPDYSLYPQFKHAIGFLTRGCIRSCDFCIVSKKEGYIREYRDIETVLQGRESAVLMDNNVLGCDFGIKQIEKIIDLKIKVDFNQGLDARLIDYDMAKLLKQVKWIRQIRIACDSEEMIKQIERVVDLFKIIGVSSKMFFVYCLITDNLEESYKRINILKRLGVDVFAQPYIDFTKKSYPKKWQNDLAYWVNKKMIFKSCDFKEFKPRKDFKCSKYFDN